MKNNKKGISLPEIMIYFALVVVVSPIVLSVFLSCTSDYNTSTRYIRQQDKVIEATHLIRKDVEFAQGVIVDEPNKILHLTFYDGTERFWRFAGNALETSTDGVIYTSVVGELDTSGMDNSFKRIGNSLILRIQPQKTNINRSRNRNIVNPIITEFSVKYKQ
ncbi:MAG: hypothetical protein N3I35_07875 [Clostridia bacterium]|nr:hypothetical protein [Clostridia bacterium]